MTSMTQSRALLKTNAPNLQLSTARVLSLEPDLSPWSPCIQNRAAKNRRTTNVKEKLSTTGPITVLRLHGNETIPFKCEWFYHQSLGLLIFLAGWVKTWLKTLPSWPERSMMWQATASHQTSVQLPLLRPLKKRCGVSLFYTANL